MKVIIHKDGVFNLYDTESRHCVYPHGQNKNNYLSSVHKAMGSDHATHEAFGCNQAEVVGMHPLTAVSLDKLIENNKCGESHKTLSEQEFYDQYLTIPAPTSEEREEALKQALNALLHEHNAELKIIEGDCWAPHPKIGVELDDGHTFQWEQE